MKAILEIITPEQAVELVDWLDWHKFAFTFIRPENKTERAQHNGAIQMVQRLTDEIEYQLHQKEATK